MPLKFRYLAVAYWALLVYASLYPFTGWRDPSLLVPGVADLVTMGLPRYWTAFDVIANLLVYVLAASILAWGLQGAKNSIGGPLKTTGAGFACVLAFLLASLLSFVLEWLQVLLPSRVPSILDWILNSLGALLGAAVAWTAPRAQIETWVSERFCGIRGSGPSAEDRPIWLIWLIFLWFAAQLSPQGLPFSVGEWVGFRPILDASLQASRLSHSLPSVSSIAFAYGPLLEAGATALTVVVMGLLIQSLGEPLGRPALLNPVAPTLAFFGLILCVKAAVAAWLLGPSAAFAWLTAAVQGGLFIGLSMLSILFLVVRASSRRLWWLVLVLLAILTILFNLSPESEYRLATMPSLSPKRLRALESLLAWLSMFWPALAAIYALSRIRR